MTRSARVAQMPVRNGVSASVVAVPAGHWPSLLDFLAQRMPGIPRSEWDQRLSQGLVLQESGQSAQADQPCMAGQRFFYYRNVADEPLLPMSATVLFEDDHLLVVNKPAGLVVHPAPGNWRGTLLNGLLAHHTGARFLPRAGIVHRLDKDTSGLMVVARTRQAMDALVQKIAAREVRRQYLALAHKPWTGPSPRTVEAPIGRDPANRLRMAVVDLAKQSGKTAHTSLRCLESQDSGCLVHCTLHTGRTHQIRVHLASQGHPIAGDDKYGDFEWNKSLQKQGLKRMFLHAWRLQFTHPATSKRIELKSNLPPELQLYVNHVKSKSAPPSV